jgi:5-methylcytosine-specific restriction endonuclease McrA
VNDTIIVDGKKCRICGEIKAFSEFYKRKETRDGYRAECKQCKAVRAKEYRDEHVEEIKEKKARYRKENRELIKKSDKLYRQKNYDKIRNRQKKWNEKNKEKYLSYFHERYENNKDEILEQQRQFYKLNREKVLEQNKRWKMKNIERYRDYHQVYFKTYYNTPEGRENYYKNLVKRRSYKHKVDFKPFERKEILDRDNWTCKSCGCKVHDRSKGNWNTPDKAHIDHIIPISKGGNSESGNLQVLCRTCNLSKADNVETQLSLNI